MRRLFIPLLCKLLTLACGSALARAPTDDSGRGNARSSRSELERPTTIEVDELVVSRHEVRSIGELLARAHLAWQAGQPDVAANQFDDIVRLGPDSRAAAEAAYWAGLAWEEAGRHELAASRFEAVGRHHPGHLLAANSLLRAVRLWGYLDQWSHAGEVAAHLLDLDAGWTAIELVALHSALALASFERADLSAGHYHLTKGRAVASRVGLDQLEVIPRDMAQLYFALGEWRRLSGARIVFDPPPLDFALQFEQRAQWLLDAQSAYLDVMRARDARWSTMAGFRIGELYHQLHRDVQRAPRPPGIPEHRVPLFQAALKLRYLVLLEKGLVMYERTIALAKRTGEDSDWVERAAEQKAHLEASLSRERAAIAASPYSEEDLRSILAEIQARQ